MKKCISFAVFLLTLLNLLSAQPKNVLYFNSYHQDFGWSDSVTKGIKNVFSQNQEEYHLFIEYLDLRRFPDSKIQEAFLNYLSTKYSARNISLIIASDNLASDFAVEYAKTLHLPVPLVLCGITNPEKYTQIYPDVYGVLESFPQVTGPDFIEKCFPDIQNLYYIIDCSANSLLTRQMMEQNWKISAPHLRSSFVPFTDPDSVIGFCKGLKKGDAAIVLSMFVDHENNSLIFDQYIKEISEAITIPVFSGAIGGLGFGIVGGRYILGTTHGEKASTLALEILKGQIPDSNHRWRFHEPDYRFDYRVLKRFNYTKNELPIGSKILFKPESFYQKYQDILPWILLIIGGLLIIVLILSINILRRKRAEAMVRNQLDEILLQRRKLSDALEELNQSHEQLREMNLHLEETNEALDAALKLAEESDRLKSVFLGNISHEFRTPLNAILGFANILKSTGARENEEFSKHIINAGERLLSLVEDLILVSKLETNQVKIDPKEFTVLELQVVINAFVHTRISNNTVPSNPVGYITELPGDQETIYADFWALQTVLKKLLDNAIKFTENGVVRMQVLNLENHWEFSVKDTGMGIPEEKWPNLFQRFYKMEERQKLFEGTGLGLYIVKRLTEMWGGSLSFQSSAGRGSIFRFTIPKPSKMK